MFLIFHKTGQQRNPQPPTSKYHIYNTIFFIAFRINRFFITKKNSKEIKTLIKIIHLLGKLELHTEKKVQL